MNANTSQSAARRAVETSLEDKTAHDGLPRKASCRLLANSALVSDHVISEGRLLDAAKLSVPQTAKRLGIGETKLRAVIQRGEIPVLRIGGKTVIIEQDIEIYLRGSYGRMRPIATPKPLRDVAQLPKAVCESPLLRRGRTRT